MNKIFFSPIAQTDLESLVTKSVLIANSITPIVLVAVIPYFKYNQIRGAPYENAPQMANILAIIYTNKN